MKEITLGVWHAKNDFMETFYVTDGNIEELKSDGGAFLREYTDKKPVVGEQCQYFNSEADAWEVDGAKKKEARRAALLSKIQELENKGLRPNREITLGVDVGGNREFLLAYQTEIEELRLELNGLEGG
jgi:hypothetical protein